MCHLRGKDVPQLPTEIKDAVDSGDLAVFTGAGASRLIGCKGWEDLAQDLVTCCYDWQRWTGSSNPEFDPVAVKPASGQNDRLPGFPGSRLLCDGLWQERQDSNPRPAVLETAALTRLSYAPACLLCGVQIVKHNPT